MSEIELSNNVLIPCPDRGFAMRRAVKCLICNHYKGILRAEVNGKPIEGNEADVLQIICGRPITRKLIKIDED